MKNLFSAKWLIPMVIVSLVSCFSLTSCSDDDDDIPSANLVGTWELTRDTGWEKTNGTITDEWDEADSSMRVKFEADGTITQYERSGSRWVVELTGTWSISGSTLKATWIEDDEQEIGYYTVSMPDEDTLILSSTVKDGSYEYYFKEYLTRVS